MSVHCIVRFAILLCELEKIRRSARPFGWTWESILAQRVMLHWPYIYCYPVSSLGYPHSGPATFLPSSSPELGSLISSQLTASRVAPVVPDTAKRTPSEFCAVERKSAGERKPGSAAKKGGGRRDHRRKSVQERESPSDIW